LHRIKTAYIQTDEGWVNTQNKSNKKQKMGTYAVTHRCSAFTKDLPVFKIRVAHPFSVLCSPIMYIYALGSVL
jgi:hypothetical protein